MNEDDFLETVRREASLEATDEARTATEATLRTLGERLTDGEAEDLARELPDGIASPLIDPSPGEAEPLSLEAFADRVSDRAGIDEDDVTVHARAVATALSDAAGEELETAREQLPSEFDVLFEPGGPVTEGEFFEVVRKRADLESEAAARRAATSTLRTLGERLTAGEAEDLALYLPEPFADALREGGEEATAYSFEEFVSRVAQRAGVEKAEVRTRARAVGSALADAASEREITAAKEQLPDPFGVVFDPPTDGDESTN